MTHITHHSYRSSLTINRGGPRRGALEGGGHSSLTINHHASPLITTHRHIWQVRSRAALEAAEAAVALTAAAADRSAALERLGVEHEEQMRAALLDAKQRASAHLRVELEVAADEKEQLREELTTR